MVNARELTEGQEVDLVLLVRERADGRVMLADRTASLSAAIPAELAALCEPGACVRVAGRVERGRLLVEALRPARTDEYVLDDLLDGPRIAAERMESDLRELIATVQCVHLRALLECVFGPGTETWAAFREAPAAKRYHQAYRLQGEIPLGYYRVRRLIEDIPGFPDELAAAVLHIILSHHGQLEHGSPVVPCTREATLVHMIDNLGGRLGSFDRLEKALPEGSRWSGYDRALGAGAWFASRERQAA